MMMSMSAGSHDAGCTAARPRCQVGGTAGESNHATLALPTIIECFHPLLADICNFLAASPKDITRFCHMTSRSLVKQCESMTDDLWCTLYVKRWPAFHSALEYYGEKNWRKNYADTFAGHIECCLEIYDREKKIGFAMSAMPARVRYNARVDAYIACYISAAAVEPETIPSATDSHRLRFCPASVRGQLLPGAKNTSEAWLAYPHRVLEGIDGLVVGNPIELQWKMQNFSPFGWWYGILEKLRYEQGEKTGIATITFPHFPEDSAWYRLEVRFGDSDMNPCFFGGKTGGIRSVGVDEQQHWLRFLPKAPLRF